jgi:prepilin-type processing-associated H-X9-DG protein
MKYQLILQLRASSAGDYDEMVELEEIIIGNLANLGFVDGHDAGSGEINIFILTDSPKAAFDRIRQTSTMRDVMADLKVAYREIGKDDFTVLHPEGLTRFAIA